MLAFYGLMWSTKTLEPKVNGQPQPCPMSVTALILAAVVTNKRHTCTCTVKTLNIGTPRPATVVVLNIKQFNFTMK